MKPKPSDPTPQDDLYRDRLENLINQRHELVRLAGKINWQVFVREWSGHFPSERGAPAAPTRLIAGLLYLKHIHALSDEVVVRQWVENPYWQYFCREMYFQHELPIHPTSLTR